MGFGGAIASCFRKYVTFSGRARRPEYWYFMLFFIFVYLAAVAFDAVIVGQDGFPIATAVVFLGAFLPSYAVGWRRLHDIGRSGWWFLSPVLVMLAAALLVVLAFVSGLIDFSAFEVFERPGFRAADTPPEMIAILAIVSVAYLASIVLTILLVVWLCWRSQSGSNRFGPEPGAEVRVEGVFD